MKPVLEVPLSEDLAPFTALLWEYQVPHRVVETHDRQVVLISSRIDPERIRALYSYWKQGGDLSRVELRAVPVRRLAAVSLAQVPVTLALILLSLALSLLIGFGLQDEWMMRFTLVDYTLDGNRIRFESLSEMLASGQWWRLLTPIFLHFSVLHVLFNLLWVWVVGARIEQRQGWATLLGLVLLSGVASNLAQYWVSGPMFGGMSGVVFGLLGYTWLWDRLQPQPLFDFPPALMGFMLFWLALGFTGALEAMGLGAIANTAHLVGLLGGLLYVALRRLVASR